MPAAFLQQRYSHLERRTGQRWLRRIGLDLTCLEDYNLPDLQQRYLAMAEALDLSMEIFPHRRLRGGIGIASDLRPEVEHRPGCSPL